MNKTQFNASNNMNSTSNPVHPSNKDLDYEIKSYLPVSMPRESVIFNMISKAAVNPLVGQPNEPDIQ